MTELNKEIIERPSKFNRLKSKTQLEFKSFIKPPQMDMNQLRKPSSFFKSSLKNPNRKQKSVDRVTSDSTVTDITPDISPNIDEFPNTFNSPEPVSIENEDINLSPEIKQVSNFDSPTRTISSSDESASLNFKAPLSPIKFVLPTVPKINIITDDEPAIDVTIDQPSKLSKLKKKTLSMFFDPQPVSNTQTQTTNENRSILNTAPSRPKLNKALSDGKQETLKQDESDKEIEDNNSSIPTQLQTDLFRKRSRTLGSVENDLYHKRNSSLVKTIGSMVMLKPKQEPVSNNTSDSDSTSLLKPSSPPEASEDDTPETYINRLIEDGFESEITTILSDSDSEFFKQCLNYFIDQKFDFKDDSLDLALRKFLMICDLPKEAQQIDRVLSSFSLRFYESNKAIWENPDQIYFITFSLVMLHTDHFNVNNKKKMSKAEFVKNTKVDNKNEKINNSFLSKEILEYFYDNITFTKLIQKNKPNPSPPLYSLPRRIFSSASSTNLESLTQHTNPPTLLNTRSQSISSSTSQFFSSNQVDPYYLIITDQIDSLKLSNEKLRDENPFISKLRNTFPESYYQNMRDSLLGPNGFFINFNKNCNWLTGKTEIQFKSDSEIEYGPTCLLKIIKIAELYREETVKNSIFFPIGNSNKVIWKKCFGVLTTCGFFIFDNLNFLPTSERERIIDHQNIKIEEPIIIEILSESALKACSKLAINGLFACQSTDDDHHSFNIYSTNKKELFSSSTFSEMTSWIIAINYIAALDSCYIDLTPNNNNEVVPIRNITIEEKIAKLTKNTLSSIDKIHGLVNSQHHLNNLVPFSSKTKENLLDYYKSLMIRIDWLWYEVERNQVYIKILEKELQQYEDIESLRTKDGESFLEDSFINDQLLDKVTNERVPHPTPLTRDSSITDKDLTDETTDASHEDEQSDYEEEADTTIFVDSVESQ